MATPDVHYKLAEEMQNGLADIVEGLADTVMTPGEAALVAAVMALTEATLANARVAPQMFPKDGA